jgi:hypothetical protein
MLIARGDSEFEIHICVTDEGEWEGQIVEYNMSRVLPTSHLRHSWVSLEAALAGVRRRWQRLFPDETAPDFREAVSEKRLPFTN